jgi:uncharacterized protein YkwD
MLRRISIALATTLLIIFLSGTAFASFSDVAPASQNYTAIQYLKINNILGGYPDGTFRPAQAVTRAEFLKILIGGLKIPTAPATSSGFTDVDESAWYAPYINTAKKSGWVSGYGDNTFKPAQFVSKAEAIKIIAMAEKWTTPNAGYIQPYIDTPASAWFTPHIYQAKTKSFLEDTGRFYSPAAQMTRGQVSEVLFRINITKSNNAVAYSANFSKNLNLNETSPGIPYSIKEYSPQEITNLGYKNTTPNFYEGMILNSEFPNIFFQNEIYYFEGTLTAGGKQVFLFLAPEKSTDPDKYTNYAGEITGNKFIIPVTFNSSGKFKMGIIPGESGVSKIIDITVIPGIPKNTASLNYSSIAAPQINYSNRQTSINWNNNGNNFNKITFKRGTAVIYYICRQNKENLIIDYSKFQSFLPGPVEIKVEGAKSNPEKPYELSTGWSISPTTKFTAANHTYSDLNNEALTVVNFLSVKNNLDQITFTGNTKNNINVEAAIIKPDGMVETAALTTKTALIEVNNTDAIPAGSTFTFSYTPSAAGTYSIEINNLYGQAVLNMPVYVKNGIPLIPNYFDLHQNDPPVENYDLTSYRNQLLNLINEERTKAGLRAVTIDSALNSLAQNHTDNMVKRGFFGHVDPDGIGPDERRIKAGIASQVGENLANASDIYFSHYGLMQSAVHRKNILDPEWTKVGIGMSKNTDGNYLTAEEFSLNPLSANDLTNIEQSIFGKLNLARTDSSLRALTENSALKNIALEWSNIMAVQNFNDTTSPNGQTLEALISKSGINKTIYAIVIGSNNTDILINKILNSPESNKSTWKEIGIGIKVDKIGNLKATLLFSN